MKCGHHHRSSARHRLAASNRLHQRVRIVAFNRYQGLQPHRTRCLILHRVRHRRKAPRLAQCCN